MSSGLSRDCASIYKVESGQESPEVNLEPLYACPCVPAHMGTQIAHTNMLIK